MERILKIAIIILAVASFIGQYNHAAQASGEVYKVYDGIYDSVEEEDDVREITYEQFQKIRGSGEKYVLLDVLGSDSYASGHIENAVSFPLDTINKKTAAERLTKDSRIIVYCGSFECPASTMAAKKLDELDYKALDYKGGLKEWQEKGNKLVK